MAKQMILKNVVDKKTLREIQSKTLSELSDILSLSFGPNGSNACIKKENALSRYSKDGHTIISALHYNGIIEQSIKDDIESITRHVVKTVGDGTTSAVILSDYIFDKLRSLEDKYTPGDIVKTLNKVVEDIKDGIKDCATELTVQDVYDIAMISTNGNEFISNTLKDIYDKFGTSVFIDVSVSLGDEFAIKSYDGMTLNTGYCDSCYVTNQKENTAEVDHPQVYFFEDPIDTREIAVYFDSIISNNIIKPVNEQNYDSIIPTVIFAPKISSDVSSLMDSLTSNMAQMPVNNRLPICIITAYHETEQLTDLAKMCGAKLIRKYIDKNIYEEDVKQGRAPTPETIFNWGGTCDKVVAYSDKTKFIRPKEMYNEDGSYSELYNNLLAFLETELENARKNGEDGRYIGNLKRRLNSLKSNMVELFVGGITQADRDQLRDLVEDAVLNIRSAAENGVGFGANMLGVAQSARIAGMSSDSTNELYKALANCIADAYVELFERLYRDIIYNNKTEYIFHNIVPEEKAAFVGFYNDALKKIKEGLVWNIRSGKWDNNVKTSIMSDIVILDTVSKIVGIMATCNQFILPTAMHNIYID